MMTMNWRKPNWQDIMKMNSGAASIAAGRLGEAIQKEEGYAIWHVRHDVYLFLSEGHHIGWNPNDFSLIREEDIEVLQEVLWTRWSVKDHTQLQHDLYQVILPQINHLQVIPCVLCEGEEPNLDFVNAFRFDGADRVFNGTDNE